MRRWTLCTLVIAGVGACGGDDTGQRRDVTGEEDGTADVDTAAPVDTFVAPDTMPADTAGTVLFGEPCGDNIACDSGWCVPSASGLVCTHGCEDGCPTGWECGRILNRGTDFVDVCLDGTVTLCQPCEADADCAAFAPGANHRCLDAGAAGRFCGKSCVIGDTQCPPGFSCVADDDPAEGQPGQCMPDEGLETCACNALGSKLTLATPCRTENALGVCEGWRWCGEDGLTACDAAPAVEETCNNRDDDCDGQTDEGLPAGEACAVVNAFGSCPGVGFCVAGEVECVGVPAEAEVCDGRDQDCDGQTDEGFPDFDGDHTPDCMDTDDDDDGTPDDQDCAPKDAAISKTATEVCGDGVDNDCDGMKDEEGATGCALYYRDVDQDGRGSEALPARCLCAAEGATAYTVQNQEDCDDLDEDVHPGAAERCNGKDDDCNGATDEGVQAPCGGCVNVCLVDNGAGTTRPFALTGSNGSNVAVDGAGALSLTSGQTTGWYRQVLTGWPSGSTHWSVVFVDATLSGTGTVRVRYRVGATATALASATWSVSFGPYPPQNFPLYINANAPLLEVELTLTRAAAGDATPVVRSLSVLGEQG